MIPEVTTIDLETFRIDGRPNYPPVPVGVAIKQWDRPAEYHGFGHVVPDTLLASAFTWNNSSGIHARRAIEAAYRRGPVLFHNARFDVEVIEHWFQLETPHWTRVHDSMLLLFLDDPNQRTIGLKPAAERLLGWEPEERDAVVDWLLAHQPVPGVRISKSPQGKHPPGAYIAHAPTQVVGPYAIGDVERTEALHRLLWPRIIKAGMGLAYDRERRLLPALIDMERRGVRVDLRTLESDIASYTALVNRLEAWVRATLDAPDLNVASGQQLVGALIGAKKVDTKRLGKTPTGKWSSSQEALADAVTDRQLVAVLTYLSRCRTCLGTFMWPWARTATLSGGLIYTQWRSTQGSGGGTRTGRLSSSPNFQNIPKEFDPLFQGDKDSAGENLPKPPFPMRPLPWCREYILAHAGEVLAGRDFSGQEARILAHYSGGVMLEEYQKNPKMDFHQMTADRVNATLSGVKITRKQAKTLNFAILYGAGAARVAGQLGCSGTDGVRFLDAYHRAFPAVKALQKDLERKVLGLKPEAANWMGRKDEPPKPVITIGGRHYAVEPPVGAQTFAYKMTNTLIQGSAADQTKEAMARLHEALPGRMILSVHDELILSVPPAEAEAAMAILREVMEVPILRLPVLTDGKAGPRWSEMMARD